VLLASLQSSISQKRIAVAHLLNITFIVLSSLYILRDIHILT
jgi:hypothetical protein